jgi:hypothetical protein
VIGRIRWRKRAALIGTIYSASSDSAYRVGVVPIADDEPNALRELRAGCAAVGSTGRGRDGREARDPVPARMGALRRRARRRGHHDRDRP